MKGGMRVDEMRCDERQRQAALHRLAAMLPEQIAGAQDVVAVAWSGGADSTALLLAMRERVSSLVAWHIDHGWRPESRRQAEWLARRAHGWGIPFHWVSLPKPTRNLEAAARRQRYAQFARWGREQGVRHLYLAHHAADQAETVCLRLLQGAGVQGCRGMAELRMLGELRLHRPWLQVDPARLRTLLRQAGVAWLEDATNRDCALRRNRIRHRLFPAMRAAGVEPCRLFARWQRQAVLLDAALSERVQAIRIERTRDGVRLSWSCWRDLRAPERAMLLQRMVASLFGEGVCAGRRHILLVEAWTQRGGHGGLDLSRSRLQRENGFLHLRRRPAMLR